MRLLRLAWRVTYFAFLGAMLYFSVGLIFTTENFFVWIIFFLAMLGLIIWRIRVITLKDSRGIRSIVRRSLRKV